MFPDSSRPRPRSGTVFFRAGRALCWILLAAASPAAALADQYFFDSFGTDVGLPQSNVTATVQTRDGYLWVGTESGLARFDGVRFVTFRASNAPAFVSNSIRCLCEDRERGLWIGTEAGVLRYRNGSFERIGLQESMIRAIAQDRKGRVWIGTSGQGLYRWQEGRLERADQKSDLPHPVVACLYVDSSDRLWVGFDRASGVVCLEEGRFQPYGKRLLNANVLAIGEQPRGTLWFGTHGHGLFHLQDGNFIHDSSEDGYTITDIRPSRDGGLWIAMGDLEKLAPPLRSPSRSLLRVPSKDVKAVWEDREGSLWLCCGWGDGLFRARSLAYRSISTEDGLPGNGVRSVSEDTGGNLWLSLQDFGVTRVAPDGTVKTYTKRDGFPEDDPSVAFAADDGSVWIGSTERVSVLRNGVLGSYPIRSVHGIFQDRRGALWLGARIEGVFRYAGGVFERIEAPDGKPIPYATSFCDAPDGTMYVGTWQSGLYQVKDGRVAAINHAAGLPSDEVRAVYADRDGLLWVGMKGRGLAVRENGRWLNPGALSEAVADHVMAITEDGNGMLWLGTPAGVMWAPKGDLLAAARGTRPVPKMSVAGMRDGFHAAAVWSGTQPNVWKGRDGRLLFATRRGALVVDPRHLAFSDAQPPVHVEGVSLDGRRIAPAGEVLAPAGTRDIAIEYTALSFLQPNRVLFKYKLEGYDPDWVDADTRRTAYYTNLPSGRYTFQVKACNSDGVWNEAGDRIAVIQAPHFFERRWFYGLVAAALAAAGWGVNRWSHRLLKLRLERLEQRQAMEKERRRIAKNLHDDLGAEMTELGLLAETIARAPAPAEALQETLSFSARVRGLAEALDTVVWTVNPANDSLDRLANYISGLFQDLLGKSSIRFRRDLAGEIPPHPLSPDQRANIFLTAKEAVNNVIKHSGATEARLRMKMEGNCFRLSIEDDGRGFDPAAPRNAERNGLANMRSRIEEVGGTFALSSSPGKGTSILISIRFAGPAPSHP